MESTHIIASMTHCKALLFIGIDYGYDGSMVPEDIIMMARSVGIVTARSAPYGPLMSVEAFKETGRRSWTRSELIL